MSDNPLASVLEHMLKSKKILRTYISNNSNIHHAYKVCKRLLRVASEAIEERNQRAAEVATLEAEMTTLKEKVKEHENARMRMEGALTYVEDQLATLRAAPIDPAASAPAPVAPTPSIVATPPIVYPTLPINTPAGVPASVAPVPPTTPLDHDVSSEPSDRSHMARVIKIPDPDRFYADKGKDEITYED